LSDLVKFVLKLGACLPWAIQDAPDSLGGPGDPDHREGQEEQRDEDGDEDKRHDHQLEGRERHDDGRVAYSAWTRFVYVKRGGGSISRG
jgi:hypothetical protein